MQCKKCHVKCIKKSVQYTCMSFYSWNVKYVNVFIGGISCCQKSHPIKLINTSNGCLKHFLLFQQRNNSLFVKAPIHFDVSLNWKLWHAMWQLTLSIKKSKSFSVRSVFAVSVYVCLTTSPYHSWVHIQIAEIELGHFRAGHDRSVFLYCDLRRLAQDTTDGRP